MTVAKSSGSGKARSAITGRYVTKKHAASHPKTTVVEGKKK
ncbi:hypothetical protein C8K36_10563 [Rhodococcus sp. OK519]|nr:hypothetical protein C8K36_10563 [Rhodococcus sp. OK519]